MNSGATLGFREFEIVRSTQIVLVSIILSFSMHAVGFDPDIEDTLFTGDHENTPSCQFSGNWSLVDNPTFVLNQANFATGTYSPSTEKMVGNKAFLEPGFLSAPISGRYPIGLAQAQMASMETLSPLTAYPLSLFVSKGPESPNGQGGKVFVSGAAIYQTPTGNLITAPLRRTGNFGASWSSPEYDCSNNPGGPNNCQNGTYISETGSLGIRVIDGRNNLNLVFQEDNVFRESNNSGATFTKVADLNTQIGPSVSAALPGYGSAGRILVTDAFYSRNIANQAILATAVVQMSNGTYQGLLLKSTNNGSVWSIVSGIALGTNRNTWITSIAIDRFEEDCSESDPSIIVGGYTNIGAGDSSWYIARRKLSQGPWVAIENTLTQGRFSTVNRMIIGPDRRLVVAGQLEPSANFPGSTRVGILRSYNLKNNTFASYQLPSGTAADVGLANDDTVIASTTVAGQPTALKSNDAGITWSTIGSSLPGFTSGWAYEIAADHQGSVYWIVQDGSGWKTYKLICN